MRFSISSRLRYEHHDELKTVMLRDIRPGDVEEVEGGCIIYRSIEPDPDDSELATVVYDTFYTDPAEADVLGQVAYWWSFDLVASIAGHQCFIIEEEEEVSWTTTMTESRLL